MISFERDGAGIGRVVSGHLDIVAGVFDDTPLWVAGPWNDKPVIPAVVSWRLRRPGGEWTGWRTALDVRETIPAASLFDAYFAKWARENHASVRGRYRVYLAHGFDTRTLRDGRYVVQVTTADAGGNAAHAAAAFTVENGGAAAV